MRSRITSPDFTHSHSHIIVTTLRIQDQHLSQGQDLGHNLGHVPGRLKTSLSTSQSMMRRMTHWCSPLPRIPGFDCSEFYPEVTYPSLMGDSRLEEGVESLKLLYSRFQQILFRHKLDPAISNCYKYMFEASCYFYLPRCQDNNMLVPCREMCEDLLNGCGWVSEEVRDLFDCTYLPPRSGSVPCFYKHVTCAEPEVPERALVVDGMNYTFTAPSSHVTFRCEDGFLLEGPATVRCLYGGRWSEGTAVCGGGRPAWCRL